LSPPWFDVPPDVPVRSWRSCESADSAGRSAPARLPLSIRRITFFVMNGPRCESPGTAPQPLSIMLCITCSGSRNESASQRTVAGSTSVNDACGNTVRRGSIAACGLCSSFRMASSAAAGPVPVPLSVMTSPHAASPALSAAFGSGLLRIGGRPGGNRWSPANCKLFGVTAAGESVTESARGGGPRACTCASIGDGGGICRVEESGSRERESVGDDGGRWSPAVGTDFVALFILYSVRCGVFILYSVLYWLCRCALLVRLFLGSSGYAELDMDADDAEDTLPGYCMSNGSSGKRTIF
jgi:hypothetical protein